MPSKSFIQPTPFLHQNLNLSSNLNELESSIKKFPIGVFDSGFGGLSILQDLQKTLPTCDFLYLGDNARAPYGNRSFETIYKYTLEAVRYLFSQGCALVILACNTASARALRTIQMNDLSHLQSTEYPKRVLGVIRPMAEELATFSKSKKVGILATPGTISSKSYNIELEKFAPELDVFSESCPLWVPLIENHEYLTEAGQAILKKNLDNLLHQDPNIDTILLGCTHFPLIINELQNLVPKQRPIHFVSQGPIVALKTAEYLKRHPEIASQIAQNGQTQFLTTDNALDFNEKASYFLKQEVISQHVDIS